MKTDTRNSTTFLLISLGMASAMGPFVTDFYLPALPQLTTVFSTTSSAIQMSLTLCLIGLAIGQLFIGPISDKYGRKMPLIVSMVIFSLATLCCLLTTDIYIFLACRFLQGLSGAGGIVISKSVASDLHTRWLQAKDEVRLAARRFAWACYADSAIVPQDTSLSVLPFDERSARELSQDHLSYFSMQVKEKKDLLRIERSKFFPEFSVGYAQQKIFPLRKLDSWMVGISFPLLFFPQQSRSKQAKIDWQIASYEADQNRTQLQNKVADLQGRISQQRKSLDYYSEAALREADALQESSMLKFRESEIGISELVQSLNTVREIRKGYIENVYNYNVSLLEMELYTE